MTDQPPYQISDTTYLVGSGKGGVGKSTVSVNLAIAMAALGLSVGVLDADVYGPSLPVMMGLRRVTPRVSRDADGAEKVAPFFKFGIKVISAGFFVEEARSLVWRGPILHSTLSRMLVGVDWGKLDVLLVDLPPGTGDVPLSLSKLLKIDAAIVVTTPQEVAILDAIKAINSFHSLDIPLSGVVENMAGFTVPGSEKSFPIFGEGKGAELADRFQTDLLASIPFLPAIQQNSDRGYPAAFHQGDDNAGAVFHQLAERVISKQYQFVKA